MSSVFRVKKNKDFTVMSNKFLRQKELDLKTKGLMAMILSLPPEWDYSEMGLCKIANCGRDMIRGCLKQLEKYGYLTRRQIRNPDGKLDKMEYVVYECPDDNPDYCSRLPLLENPTTVKPTTVLPTTDKPLSVHPTELNKESKSNTDYIKYPSIHPSDKDKMDETDVIEAYQKIIRENIAYDDAKIVLSDFDFTLFEEMYQIIVDMVCVPRTSVRMNGTDYPWTIVQSVFLKLTFAHLQYVLEQVKNHTEKIKNIRSYLTVSLYNSFSTLKSHYANEVYSDYYNSPTSDPDG